MSSQERTDDPGEYGYGAAKHKDSNIDETQKDQANDEDAVPSDKKRKPDADGDWPS